MKNLRVPVSGLALEAVDSKQDRQDLPFGGYSLTGKEDIMSVNAVKYNGLQGCTGGSEFRAQHFTFSKGQGNHLQEDDFKLKFGGLAT